MREAAPLGNLVAVEVLLEVRLELRLGGLYLRRQVAGEELDLLHHAPPDDLVVPVESHGQCLAV